MNTKPIVSHVSRLFEVAKTSGAIIRSSGNKGPLIRQIERPFNSKSGKQFHIPQRR